MSLRWRLTLWNAAVFAVVLIALGLILRERVRERLVAMVDAELTSRVRRLPREPGGPLHDAHRTFLNPNRGPIDQSPIDRGPYPQAPGGWDGDRTNPDRTYDPTHRRDPDDRGPNPDDPFPGNPQPFRPDGQGFVGKGPDGQNPIGQNGPGPRRGPAPPVYFADGSSMDAGGAGAIDPNTLRLVAADGMERFSERGGWRLYTVRLPFTFDNRRAVLLQEKESMEPVATQVAQVSAEMVTLLPIALLAAIGTGLFLTDRALRPIGAVTRAAAAIEADDLAQRLPVHGRDELARLSSTFNAMLGRLEDAFTRQKRFVADASHELRTPLTIVKATAEIGAASADDPATGALFKRIDRAADRTIRLTQDLLQLAKSDARALPVAPEPIEITAFLEGVAADARLLRPNGARIRVEAADAPAMFTADRVYLTQLLMNLIENALRHTPSDGEVALRVSGAGDQAVALTIADNGAGIAPEHLPHLGEPFYRADESRTRRDGGAGLGLAICRAIAHAHHGTLEIDSAPGVGTTVTVVLPNPAPHQDT